MTWTRRAGMLVGLRQSCGYTVEDRVAVAGLRRTMSAVFLVFFGLNFLQNLHPHGALRIAVAAGDGLCFAAIVGLGWAMAMRSGDEYRRKLMVRSLHWGVGITVTLACVAGYTELALGETRHVPMLAVPVCLILTTVAAKLMLFRRANG